MLSIVYFHRYSAGQESLSVGSTIVLLAAKCNWSPARGKTTIR